MTNEIKEILEALKPHNDIVKEYPLTLSIEEQKILLDYITNLQEENEKLKKIKKEQQEQMNELRELFIKDEHKLLNDNQVLQQRIDKAVEYIKWSLDKNEELIEYFNYDANFNELLNILRGDE